MAKGKFEENDALRIAALVESKEKTSTKTVIDLQYEDDTDDIKDFTIPVKTFSYLIKKFRPEYLKHTPYTVKVKKLNRGDNRWLKKVNLLGLNKETHLELHVHPDASTEVRPISILWLLLHEFKHHVQYNTYSIRSMTLEYPNYEFWKNEYMVKQLGYHDNTIDHVFHELAPFEIDANLFACEMLDIEYPGSSFFMTNETLELLEKNRRISFKQLLKYNIKFFKDFVFPSPIKVT